VLIRSKDGGTASMEGQEATGNGLHRASELSATLVSATIKSYGRVPTSPAMLPDVLDRTTLTRAAAASSPAAAINVCV
jgi:hypothetical protein